METGSIYAKINLDESPFTRALNNALASAKTSLGQILSETGKTAKGFDSLSKSINNTGKENTLGGLNERLQRLNSILDKTQIGSERFKAVSAAIEQTKLKIDGANTSTTRFSKVLDMAGQAGFNGFGLLTKGVVAAGIAIAGLAIGKSISIGMDFEKQMSEVGAAANATAKDFEALEGKARKLGATTSFSATQAAEGMTELAKAGLNTEQVLTATEDVLNLAKAGNLGLAEATTIAADTMAGFGLEAKNMGTIADVLAKAANSSTIGVFDLGETFKYVSGVAKSAGISLQQVAGATAILGNAGIKASQAGTTLKSIILNLSAPTKAGEESLAKMGLAMKDLQDKSGQLKSLPELFSLLNEKTANFTKTQKADIFKDLFGTESLAGGLALLDKAEMKFNATTGKMESDFSKMVNVMQNESNGFAKSYGDALSNNVSGQMANLNSAIEEGFLVIWDAIKPVVSILIQLANIVVNIGTNIIKFLFKPFKELIGFIKPAIAYLIAGFDTIYKSLTNWEGALEGINNIATSVFGYIQIAFNDFLTVIPEIGAALFDAFNFIEDIVTSVKNWFAASSQEAGILDLIVSYVKDFWGWITKSETILMGIKILLSPIVAGFLAMQAGAKILYATFELITDAGQGIYSIIQSVVSKITNSDIFKSLTDSAKKFAALVKDAFDFSKYFKSTGKINLAAMVNTSGFDLGKILLGGKSLDISGIVAKGMQAAKNMISDMGTTIYDYLNSLFPETFKTVFADFVNYGNLILNKIKEWFNKILDSLSSFWQKFKSFFTSQDKQIPVTVTPIVGQVAPPKGRRPSPVMAESDDKKKKAKEELETLEQFIERAKELRQTSDKPIEFNIEVPTQNLKDKQAELREWAKQNKIELDIKGGGKDTDVKFKVSKEISEEDKKNIIEKIKSIQTTIDKNKKLNIPTTVSRSTSESLKGSGSGNKDDYQAINEIDSAVKKLSDRFTKLKEAKTIGEKLAQGFQLASDAIGVLGAGVKEMLQATAQLANVKFNNFRQNLEFLAKGMSKAVDDGLKSTIDAINQETKAKTAAYDAQLAELKKQKDAELEAEKQFQADMEALKAQLDAKSKAENDAKFAEQWAIRQADYDAQKAAIEANTADATERAISEQALDEQAAQEKLTMRQQFDEQLAAQTDANAQTIEAQKAAHAKTVEEQDAVRTAKEQSINDAKTAMLAEQENKRTQAQDAAAQQKEQIQKRAALIEWAVGKGAFEANKKAQEGSIMISMATAIMNAMAAMAAMTAATFGFGFPIAAAMADTITAMSLAAGNTALAAVRSTQYAPPPIFAAGGMIGGQPHSSGGTLIEAERGEFIVNKGDTAKNLSTLQAINNGGSVGGNQTTIYIDGVKVQNLTNASPDMIADAVGRIIRQSTYQAVNR